MQKGFILPLGPVFGGIRQDGSFGVQAPETFDGPDAVNVHQIQIENTGGGQTVGEQRLGFIHSEAVDHPVLLRIQTRPNRFGKVWVGRQNQNGFHHASNTMMAMPD